MGTRPRHKPKRLGEKLLQIRSALELSQSELLRRLKGEEELTYHRISEYESGAREPPLWILIRYARLAGVHLEDIVDDGLELPKELRHTVRAQRVKRKRNS
ncbi:MAG: helix-turn-helix transcriptional regulator [Pyrinomonadaceae bacterium]